MGVLKKMVVWVVLVALVAAVAWLLAEKNQRSFALEQRGEELWVMRGRFFPVGVRPYQPADRALAEAYAPVPLAGESPGTALLERYDDRDELDRALFKLMRGWIEPRLASDDPERLAQAVRFLRRAERLPGTRDDQRRQLKDLEARVGYFEGRSRLEEAVGLLRDAVAKLKLAAEVRTRYGREAGDLYERVAGPAEELSRAARTPLPDRPPPRPAVEERPTPETPPAAARAPAESAKPVPSNPPEPSPPPAAPADAGQRAP